MWKLERQACMLGVPKCHVSVVCNTIARCLQDVKGQELPGGRSLVDVFLDAEEAGALRPLPFDAARHVMLSEELKHLYTAVRFGQHCGRPNDLQHPTHVGQPTMCADVLTPFLAACPQVTRAKNNGAASALGCQKCQPASCLPRVDAVPSFKSYVAFPLKCQLFLFLQLSYLIRIMRSGRHSSTCCGGWAWCGSSNL